MNRAPEALPDCLIRTVQLALLGLPIFQEFYVFERFDRFIVAGRSYYTFQGSFSLPAARQKTLLPVIWDARNVPEEINNFVIDITTVSECTKYKCSFYSQH